MLLVGLTGGIATGKSTVSTLFAVRYQIPVVDADLIAKQIVEPGQPALLEIKRVFGSDILLASGALDRPKLADLIFKNSELRLVLNRITHPRIVLEMIRQALSWYIKGKPVVVMDTPLLFEGSLDKLMHETVLVYAQNSVQEQRLMIRDNISKELAQIKISSQMPLSEKLLKATIIIENSMDKERLRKQVAYLVPMLKREQTVYSWLIWLLCWFPAVLIWTILTILKQLKI